MSKTGGVHATTATLNDIPQGVTESTRVGRKCTITNILLRLNFGFSTSNQATLNEANTSHETIRFILYWDRQCNGGGISSTDILDLDNYLSFQNISNSRRFVILSNKIFQWNSSAIAEGNGTTRSSERVTNEYIVRISKKVFIPIEFSETTTGALATIKSNNIGILIWAKHGGRMVVNDSQCRIRFLDY